MSQLFVIHRVGRDGVSVAIDITHRARIRWTVKWSQEWIPDTDSTGVVRADVAQFNRPTVGDFPLHSEIILLRVRRVGIEWSTGERSQVDGTVGRSATVVQALLSGSVNEYRPNVWIIHVGCRRVRVHISQTRKERRRRTAGTGDDRWRWYRAERVRQLQRRRVCVRRQRLHGERSCQRVL